MRHLRPHTFALCFILFGSLGYGQTWDKTWTGRPGSEAHAAVQTSDAGFLITGKAGGEGEGLLVLRTDKNGKVEWEKIYPDTLYRNGNHLVELADGNYAVIGTGAANKSEINNWVLKINIAGNILWEKKYGASFAPFDINTGVQATPDSGLIICSNELIKINKIGIIEWQKKYDKNGQNKYTGVVLTADGGYVLTGWSENYFPDHVISFLLKTDNLGNEVWVAFPKLEYLVTPSFGYDVVALGDGYVVLGIGINHKNADLILWKTDIKGNIQWLQKHKGSLAINLQALPDSGYAFAGMDADGFLFMTVTDEQGKEIHRHIFPKKENLYSVAHEILAVDNNLFLVVGTEYGEGSSSAFLSKIFFN